MVGTAFGGMETFEQQTLKLAANPEKPKVCVCVCVCVWRTVIFWSVAVASIFFSCAVDIYFVVHSLLFLCLCCIGIPVYYSSIIRKHCIRCDWY